MASDNLAKDNLVYLLDGKIYINLTNRCTNSCVFCIRSIKDDVCGKNLWLKNEVFSAQDVISQLKQYVKDGAEVIFCGYGEPTLKLEILKEVAQFLKSSYKDVKVRLNTNGHGNFIYSRDITRELKDLIDEISVSLNASNKEEYDAISKPNLKSENSFEEVKDFIQKSVQAGIPTVASVVVGYKNLDIDVEKSRELAIELGAKFRVREWLDSGYE